MTHENINEAGEQGYTHAPTNVELPALIELVLSAIPQPSQEVQSEIKMECSVFASVKIEEIEMTIEQIERMVALEKKSTWVEPKKVAGCKRLKSFPLVHQKLQEGMSPRKLAKLIMAKDDTISLTEATLVGYISHYKGSFPEEYWVKSRIPPELVRIRDDIVSGGIKNKVDTANIRSRALLIELERVEQYREEEKAGVQNPLMERMLTCLSGLADAVDKAYMEIGLENSKSRESGDNEALRRIMFDDIYMQEGVTDMFEDSESAFRIMGGVERKVIRENERRVARQNEEWLIEQAKAVTEKHTEKTVNLFSAEEEPSVEAEE